jgi:hypothetical protein
MARGMISSWVSSGEGERAAGGVLAGCGSLEAFAAIEAGLDFGC